MTSNTRQDLEDFKKSLSPEELGILERLVEARGEEYVISILGHLREDLERFRAF